MPQAQTVPSSSGVMGRPVHRVLFFGKNMSRTRCTGALVEALRQQGTEVRWHNMATLRRWFNRLRPGGDLANHWVRRSFARFAPDLVFVFCRDLPLELLEELRQQCPVVLWVEEQVDSLAKKHLDYMSRASLVSMSNPAHFEELRTHGLDNTVFLMSGFSPTFHRPVRPRRAVRDVAFIGSPGRRGQRARFLAAVSEHFDTEVFGFGWEEYAARFRNLRVRPPVDNRGYARVCASSRVVLGINEVNDDRLYFSNRTFLTLACKGFHMTHYVPGLEEVFTDGEHLVWFHDLDEAVARIHHYLQREEERRRIAEIGHRFVLRNHRYYHRVGRILEIVRGGRPARAEPLEVLEAALPQAAAGRLYPSPARD